MKERDSAENNVALTGRLRDKLSKTRSRLAGRVNALLTGRTAVDPPFLEGLEEVLFTSDIGVETTEQLISDLKEQLDRKSLEKPEQVKTMLQEEMVSLLQVSQEPSLVGSQDRVSQRLEVIMFIGVNGVGKTTTIAKMAHYFQQQGHTVMLAAADTFRAAAIEQLQIWGTRVGAEVIKQNRGADPAAVVFDALAAAQAKNINRVLIDTAGRLHTKSNLMEELKKIKRIAGQQLSGAPHKVTLVLDSTTGQNAIAQAQEFARSLGVTDIILTKLDGTAKGGVVIGISQKLGIPISFICTGEGLDDFEVFQPREFVEAIFA
ncbi:MAG: signal recognition particle-docking protein FtsY [Deltaproteobacteria bacterium]|nr:MAG: signal recognition particle-docking protein FtsY [Deltaproteobacteria bacterium]